MVEAVRGRPGGRFRVTPVHRLVLIWGDGADGSQPMVAGELVEPFEAVPEVVDIDDAGTHNSDSLSPGSRYSGPTDKDGGSYKLRQKHGGVIERRAPDGAVEFALVEGSPHTELESNALHLMGEWRKLFDRGIPFNVNGRGDAWYTEAGERRFLAHVPGGFAWPSSVEKE